MLYMHIVHNMTWSAGDYTEALFLDNMELGNFSLTCDYLVVYFTDSIANLTDT